MLQSTARHILGFTLDEQITEAMIRKAFIKMARNYHPDSPICKVSKEDASARMTELIDARECLLLLCGEYNSKSIDEDMDELKNIMGEIWESGCIWDTTKDFPSERFAHWLIQSPLVNSLMDSIQSSIQEYKKC